MQAEIAATDRGKVVLSVKVMFKSKASLNISKILFLSRRKSCKN